MSKWDSVLGPLSINAEWSDIRGKDIDDYIRNECTSYQANITLKFIRPPKIDTPYIKSLIALQLLGVGTWEEICGMAGDEMTSKSWGQDRLRSILGAKFIKVSHKGKHGKRYFELTERGEKVIDYVATH